MSDSYCRKTELRNVRSNDLYNLALILKEDWQELMEAIPKHINSETFDNEVSDDFLRVPSQSAVYERKFNNDHIHLIQSAILRPSESRLYAEILFDEWGSSGRKHERPTLGVLLRLLVQSNLYRAADFVAELLNEPNPARPTTGPAAEYKFDIPDFDETQDVANCISPTIDELQANVGTDINNEQATTASAASAAPIPKPNCIVQPQQQLQNHNNSISTTTSTSPMNSNSPFANDSSLPRLAAFQDTAAECGAISAYPLVLDCGNIDRERVQQQQHDNDVQHHDNIPAHDGLNLNGGRDDDKDVVALQQQIKPNPARPTTGPAAEYKFDIPDFDETQDVANCISPTIDELQANVGTDINNEQATTASAASAAPIPKPNCIVQPQQQLQNHNNSISTTTSTSPMNSNSPFANDSSLPRLAAFQDTAAECGAISAYPLVLDCGNIDRERVQQQQHDNDVQHHDNIPAHDGLNLNGGRDDDKDVVALQQQISNLENIPPQ